MPETHIDPVCKMLVTPETAAGEYEHNGIIYYFCNPGCKARFASDPGSFLSEPSAVADGLTQHHHGTGFQDPDLQPPAIAGGSDIEYTCPMHPEIVQIGPGFLSDMRDGFGAERDHVSTIRLTLSLLDMKRRFRISAVLTLPVFVLAMAEMFVDFNALVPAWPHGRAATVSMWIQFLLATPVVLWGGWPFFERAWASIKNASPNMFTLIAMGTGAAYLLSLAALFVPGLFPVEMRDAHSGIVPGYFEAAAVITTLVLLGQVLELRARSQTSSAIKELLRLAPETATVVYPDGSEEIDRPDGMSMPVRHCGLRPMKRYRPTE